MTVDPSRLLQMLEPAVRPGAPTVSGSPGQGKAAFENRSFEQLLSEAGQTLEGSGDKPEVKMGPSEALKALGGMGQIENAALRSVLAQARQPGSGPGNEG